jgi:hypothetical protein
MNITIIPIEHGHQCHCPFGLSALQPSAGSPRWKADSSLAQARDGNSIEAGNSPLI